MNVREMDLLLALAEEPQGTQRALAARMGISLGAVNQGLQALNRQGMIGDENRLTPAAQALLEENRPRRAVILAAGQGMRMVPINLEAPKGLIQVRGESLIERLIRQLREAGVTEISVIVGFMKEQFEHLTEDFGAELIINPRYGEANNLISLDLTGDRLENAYILPCDLWFPENPFRSRELYSWYMVSDARAAGAEVRASRKLELVRTQRQQPGNPLVGIAYLTAPDGRELSRRIRTMARLPEYAQSFWEEALYVKNKMFLKARVVPADSVVEINTYAQLKDLDVDSRQLHSQTISVICQALQASPGEISGIRVLKKGMTNESFLFFCRGEAYVMRVPEKGSNLLIDRHREARVARVLQGTGFGPEIRYLDPEAGYLITRYLSDTTAFDPLNEIQERACLAHLRRLHGAGLTVPDTHDLWERIRFYEDLWKGTPSAFRDYEKIRDQVFALKAFADRWRAEPVLTHLDPEPANFRIGPHGEPVLLDWEYAAMQDPHADVAMFGMNAGYDRAHMDRMIDLYFEGNCPPAIRVKIYIYIAACALMWSNWCEYQRNLGTEFGDYNIRQFRMAREYCRCAAEGTAILEE